MQGSLLLTIYGCVIVFTFFLEGVAWFVHWFLHKYVMHEIGFNLHEYHHRPHQG